MAHTYHPLRDADEDALRRAEHRHARRIKDKVRRREHMRWLLDQRELLIEDDDGDQ